MAVASNKEQLTAAIQKNYRLLNLQINRFPSTQTASKIMEGHAKGTKMSLEDLLSYLIGWGELVVKWQENSDNIEQMNLPETGYKWNQLGALAQKFYQDYEKYSFDELMRMLDKTLVDILQNIEKTTNFELYEKSWYGKWTLGRMIQFNTASPYNNAKNRISKYLKST